MNSQKAALVPVLVFFHPLAMAVEAVFHPLAAMAVEAVFHPLPVAVEASGCVFLSACLVVGPGADLKNKTTENAQFIHMQSAQSVKILQAIFFKTMLHSHLLIGSIFLFH
ncbi:hypothetical protein CHS0354_010474 [Potamilus streckersoni]|uniref:Secreted protein n=1 Tax=Potamilus streckersoni TaxID=2493646 RepID=A0AAE0RR86_9BIVA|nr:hypothetical protein CHS0354_010474 [Potamilus streckersoni]